MAESQHDQAPLTGSIIVFSAVQELATSRVYLLLRGGNGFYWTRASRGRTVRGPYASFMPLFADMAAKEGRTAEYWLDVFAQFRPDIKSGTKPAVGAQDTVPCA